MALAQVEGHLPDCGPFPNGCKVPLQSPHRFWIAALIPSLVSKGNLHTLLAEVQVIHIYDKIKGLQSPPLGNTTAKSSPVRRHTIYDDPLPPSCQPIFDPGSNTGSLGCPGLVTSSWAFCDGVYWRPCGSPKRLYRPRTVTLTEHVVVKVKDVCNSRPTPMKTMLARVDDFISLKEIDTPVPWWRWGKHQQT